MDNRAKIRKKYMKGKMMLTCLLHRETDKDIISWLGRQENRSVAIREALRDAIEKDNRAMCGKCKHWKIKDVEQLIGECEEFEDLMSAENGYSCMYFQRSKV